MMNENTACISAATLLHEKWRRELQDYLRPMANDDDTIWQQMTFENFAKLINNQQLYLKAYGEYSAYDEMKLTDFLDTHLKEDFLDRESIRDSLEQRYSAFEKKLFISCWYNFPDLSDVVFNAYAKGSSGIAIGTSISNLREQLDIALKKDPKIRKIVCANVQYIPQKIMRNEELFEPAQVYAPVFMKGIQFKMDHEFRVCVEKEAPEAPEEFGYNSEQNLAKAKLFEIISEMKGAEIAQDVVGRCCPNYMYMRICPKSLIQFIAIKSDSVFQKFSDNEIKECFSKWSKIEIEGGSFAMDGFRIFKIKDGEKK